MIQQRLLLVRKKVSSYVLTGDTSCVVEARKCLHEDILGCCEQLPQISWPLMIDQLSISETELPELVTLFMTELLKTKRHNFSWSENIRRLMRSYSTDLVQGVSRGDTITTKYFLLTLGVYSITSLPLFLRCLLGQYGWNCLTFAKLPSELFFNRMQNRGVARTYQTPKIELFC